jgi:hypothetical protein
MGNNLPVTLNFNQPNNLGNLFVDPEDGNNAGGNVTITIPGNASTTDVRMIAYSDAVLGNASFPMTATMMGKPVQNANLNWSVIELTGNEIFIDTRDLATGINVAQGDTSNKTIRIAHAPSVGGTATITLADNTTPVDLSGTVICNLAGITVSNCILPVAATNAATLGLQSTQVTATKGANSNSGPMLVTVEEAGIRLQAPFDFTVGRGRSISTTINLRRGLSLTGAYTVSVTGLPVGLTLSGAGWSGNTFSGTLPVSQDIAVPVTISTSDTITTSAVNGQSFAISFNAVAGVKNDTKPGSITVLQPGCTSLVVCTPTGYLSLTAMAPFTLAEGNSSPQTLVLLRHPSFLAALPIEISGISLDGLTTSPNGVVTFPAVGMNTPTQNAALTFTAPLAITPGQRNVVFRINNVADPATWAINVTAISDFIIASFPSSANLVSSGRRDLTLTVTRNVAWNNTVLTAVVSGLPSNVASNGCTLAANQNTCVISLLSSTAALGNTPITLTVTGTNGPTVNRVANTTLSIVANPSPGFTVSLDKATLEVLREVVDATNYRFTATASRDVGFNDPITIAVAPLASGWSSAITTPTFAGATNTASFSANNTVAFNSTINTQIIVSSGDPASGNGAFEVRFPVAITAVPFQITGLSPISIFNNGWEQISLGVNRSPSVTGPITVTPSISAGAGGAIAFNSDRLAPVPGFTCNITTTCSFYMVADRATASQNHTLTLASDAGGGATRSNTVNVAVTASPSGTISPATATVTVPVSSSRFKEHVIFPYLFPFASSALDAGSRRMFVNLTAAGQGNLGVQLSYYNTSGFPANQQVLAPSGSAYGDVLNLRFNNSANAPIGTSYNGLMVAYDNLKARLTQQITANIVANRTWTLPTPQDFTAVYSSALPAQPASVSIQDFGGRTNPVVFASSSSGASIGTFSGCSVPVGQTTCAGTFTYSSPPPTTMTPIVSLVATEGGETYYGILRLVYTNPQGSFGVTAPASANLPRNAATDLSVTVTKSGLADPLTISAIGLPAGITANTCSITAGGPDLSCALEFTVQQSVAFGSYPITLRATSPDGRVSSLNSTITVNREIIGYEFVNPSTGAYDSMLSYFTATVPRKGTQAAAFNIHRALNFSAALTLTPSGFPTNTTIANAMLAAVAGTPKYQSGTFPITVEGGAAVTTMPADVTVTGTNMVAAPMPAPSNLKLTVNDLDNQFVPDANAASVNVVRGNVLGAFHSISIFRQYNPQPNGYNQPVTVALPAATGIQYQDPITSMNITSVVIPGNALSANVRIIATNAAPLGITTVTLNYSAPMAPGQTSQLNINVQP